MSIIDLGAIAQQTTSECREVKDLRCHIWKEKYKHWLVFNELKLVLLGITEVFFIKT